MSKPVTRRIGASRCRIASSWIVAASSPPNPEVRGASCTITTRPVFFTDVRMRSLSKGTSVRRSMTSRSKPRAAPFSAASSAVATIALHAMTVT